MVFTFYLSSFSSNLSSIFFFSMSRSHLCIKLVFHWKYCLLYLKVYWHFEMSFLGAKSWFWNDGTCRTVIILAKINEGIFPSLSVCVCVYVGKVWEPKTKVDPILEDVTLEPELEEALSSATDAELCDIAGTVLCYQFNSCM